MKAYGSVRVCVCVCVCVCVILHSLKDGVTRGLAQCTVCTHATLSHIDVTV